MTKSHELWAQRRIKHFLKRGVMKLSESCGALAQVVRVPSTSGERSSAEHVVLRTVESCSKSMFSFVSSVKVQTLQSCHRGRLTFQWCHDDTTSRSREAQMTVLAQQAQYTERRRHSSCDKDTIPRSREVT